MHFPVILIICFGLCTWLYSVFMIKRMPKNPYAAFGDEILDMVKDYAKETGGLLGEWDKTIERIKTGKNEHSVIFADLLNAFMPHYNQNLYAYYKAQEYHSLFRFLQYPFMGDTLRHYINPYQDGIKELKSLDVLDYGCGIPYGLLHGLKTNPEAFNSVTLVDFDLVYTQVAEYLVRRLAPGLKLNIIKLKNTELASLDGPYNFIYVKDVFEHLTEPEKLLDYILSKTARQCMCYFDLRNHGACVYQHVSPSLAPLKKRVESLAFVPTEQDVLTRYLRAI